MKRWRAYSSALVLLAAAAPAHAQQQDSRSGEAASAARTAPSNVLPPRLIGPEPMLTRGCSEPVVDVLVTIDRTGAVTDAVVAEGKNPELATAARASALTLQFEPALQNGQPIVARITYRVACEETQSPNDVVDGGASAARIEAPSTVSPSETARANGSLPGQDAPAYGAVTESGSAAEAADTTEPEALDVFVHGQSTVERLQRSANAVSVAELTTARQRTGTLGEVLARQEGASVRTMGGLGGFTRFSLDGLSNEQVRFFIDGVPLRYAGYSLGIANVPVDQLDHVEIYHGVVPSKFGADALGGAVNLSTLGAKDGSSAGASIATGSFGITRFSASLTHRDSREHYMVRANAFRDRADNDYTLENVTVLDSRGQVSHVSLPHFHNRYAADGVGLELGLVDKPWAKHLVLRGFYTDHHKDIPHDDVGVDNQNPYGEVTYARTASGLLMTHQMATDRMRLDTRLGFTNERLQYRDVSRCSYDWYGRCAVERRSRGEVSAVPVDANISDNFWLARIDGSWLATPFQEVRLSIAPTLSSRQGKDDVLLEHIPDALAAERRFITSVAGAEYEVRDEDNTWTNSAFGKWYARYLDADETLPNGNRREWNQLKTYGGFGDGIRLNLSEWAYAKASYEYAIRFPSLEEIFGDGSQIIDNLALASERSHNANLELHGEASFDDGSEAAASFRGFGRFLSDRIWLQAVTGYSIYHNVPHSRVVGGEGMVQWTAAGKWLHLLANGTWMHSRDTSGDEPVRLPSDPWFFANAQATLTRSQVIDERDSVSFDWNVGYVHGFPLSTGERGNAGLRLRVDAQTIHTAALRYALAGETGTLSAAAEMNNVLDALVMDFYGVQRPGRAFFLKLSFQVRSSLVNKGQ